MRWALDCPTSERVSRWRLRLPTAKVSSSSSAIRVIPIRSKFSATAAPRVPTPKTRMDFERTACSAWPRLRSWSGAQFAVRRHFRGLSAPAASRSHCARAANVARKPFRTSYLPHNCMFRTANQCRRCSGPPTSSDNGKPSNRVTGIGRLGRCVRRSTAPASARMEGRSSPACAHSWASWPHVVGACQGSTKIKEGNPIQTASGTRSRWTIASDHEVSRRDRKRWSMKRLTTAVSNAPGTGVSVAKPQGCDRLSSHFNSWADSENPSIVLGGVANCVGSSSASPAISKVSCPAAWIHSNNRPTCQRSRSDSSSGSPAHPAR